MMFAPIAQIAETQKIAVATMFATLGRRTALVAARRTAVMSTKRRMGSSAPAQEWTGIDKVVRGYFPKDEQREFINGWGGVG